MGEGVAGVGLGAGDFAVAEEEADFLAVTEDADFAGGEEGVVGGDEDHGAVVEAGDADLGGALALEEVVVEFGEAE